MKICFRFELATGTLLSNSWPRLVRRLRLLKELAHVCQNKDSTIDIPDIDIDLECGPAIQNTLALRIAVLFIKFIELFIEPQRNTIKVAEIFLF